MDDSTPREVGDEPGKQRIESWEDLVEHFGWVDDPFEPAKSVLLERFALVDAVDGLVRSLSHINSQPTTDFEGQYQAGYEVIARASAQLEHESQRVETADAAFGLVVDALRADVARQRERIAEYLEEHTGRHRRFREAMVPVEQQNARDRERAGEEQSKLQHATNQEIAKGQAAQREARKKLVDDRNREWLENHKR